MMAISSFRSRLLWAMTGVAVPLLILNAVSLYEAYAHARSDAYEALQLSSEGAANNVATALLQRQSILSKLAVRPELQDGDGKSCNKFLAFQAQIDPAYEFIGLVDEDGRLLCGAPPLGTSSALNAPKRAWLASAIAATGFSFGSPGLSSSTELDRLILALPVRQADGQRRGLVTFAIPVEVIARELASALRAPGGAAVLIDHRERILVRTPEPLRYRGYSVPDVLTAARFGQRHEPPEAVGFDGVRRRYVTAPLPVFQLRVGAGVPAAGIFATIRRGAWERAALATILSLLAASLALIGANRLAKPVKELASAVHQGQGGATFRAPQSLPSEFRQISAGLNKALESSAENANTLRDSKEAAARTARFREAASQATLAITRHLRPQEIFDTICSICVDTGSAKLAWVAIVETSTVTPAAHAGFPPGDNTLLFEALGRSEPPAKTLKEGVPCVVNDFQMKPMLPSQGTNLAHEVIGSAASFPLKRGGSVIGALTLYTGIEERFEAGLIQLLEEMAGDISFGLDLFDREVGLYRREIQLDAIVETARDAILTVGLDFKLVVFNQAACEMFGVTKHEVLGTQIQDLLPVDDRELRTRQLAWYAMHGDKSGSLEVTDRLRGLRRNGSEFPIHASISRAAVNGTTLVTVVMRDITGIREAEQVRLSAVAAETANRAKTGFLSRMSHELRTPLNAVNGFSQLLIASAGARLTQDERHQLDLIFLAGTQLLALVDDVLDVSRIEAGNLTVSVKDVEVNHHLKGVVRMSEGAAVAGGITLLSHYSDKPMAFVTGDPVRLRQVLLNLVSNAIKYNKPGGCVHVDYDVTPLTVEIRVEDTGLGMSSKQLERLFEPFNRLGRERSDIAGTGIGLMLSRQLVHLMNGTIDVSSKEGEGTTVIVRMPLGNQQSSVAPELPGTPAGDTPVDPSNPPKGTVLYIEDNAVNALIVEQLLSRWPEVNLVVAVDGSAGLREAFTLKPDLILLDMFLPDATGIEVMGSLRSDPRTANIPIVALSASAMETEVSAALKAGAAQYWAKPVEFTPFLQGVESYLRTARELDTPAPDAHA